ncbi:MAG: class I SAM-dependent methyltransferase [Treponema sp.]|nr:class I SAM-dependent methyltransferase [Treponema sp.]
MEYIQNVAEYYDELYPVTDTQKKFYANIKKSYPMPVKFLQIGCGTGALEHVLAQDGSDVTGLEVSKELIAAASLRKRTQLTAVRFFQLSTLDMTRFLGKGFYNVISCLNSRIIFIHDRTLLKKFFFDSKTLLSKNGTLVLSLLNFHHAEQSEVTQLPELSSIRVKMISSLKKNGANLMYLNQQIETGNGKILKVMDNEEIYPLMKEEIVKFGKEAGFAEFYFYDSFNMDEYTNKGNMLICVMK